MFCGKCGTLIPEGTVFCGECGVKIDYITSSETNNEAATVLAIAPNPKPMLGSRKKVLIIAISAILVCCVIAIVGAVTNNGRRALYNAVGKTIVTHQKELAAIIAGNPVLKKTKNLLAKSSTQFLKGFGTEIYVHDDKQKKILKIEARIPGESANAELFITDKNLFLGIPSARYIEADAKNIGGEVGAFLDANDLSYGYEAEQLLKPFDFSYSNFGQPKKEEIATAKQRKKACIDLFEKLAEKSIFEESKTSVLMGDKEVESKLFTLTANKDTIVEWLEKDVLPAVTRDKALISMYEDLHNTDLLPFNDGGDLIYGLEYIIENIEDEVFDITLNLYTVKGIIVEANLSVETKYRSYDFEIEAKGKKLKMEDFTFVMKKDGRIESKIQLYGVYSGQDVLTYSLAWIGDGERTIYDVEWDTKSESNNLKIKGRNTYTEGEKLKATFAVVDNEVEARIKAGFFSIRWYIQPLQEKIILPENKTFLLKNVDLTDLDDMLTESIYSLLPLIDHFY